MRKIRNYNTICENCKVSSRLGRIFPDSNGVSVAMLKLVMIRPIDYSMGQGV
jgi:hypothetical protein